MFQRFNPRLAYLIFNEVKHVTYFMRLSMFRYYPSKKIYYCMFELFFQKFNEKVKLTSVEEEIIRTYLTPKKLRKRQYLLQEGDVCRSIAFVEKGALREYSVDENGPFRTCIAFSRVNPPHIILTL